MKKVIGVFSLFLFSFLLSANLSAETVTWIEDFKDNILSDEWQFRDLQSQSSAWMVKAWERTVTEEGEDHWGALHITNREAFGHTQRDRPMLEHVLPKAAARKLTIKAIFGYYKPIADTFMGLFLLGQNQSEFAYICFGGEAGQVTERGLKIVSGSSIPIWQKRTKTKPARVSIHFHQNHDGNAGVNDGYIELKIVKEDDRLRGYYRRLPDDLTRFVNEDGWLPVRFDGPRNENKWVEVRQSFHTPWEHDFDVKRMGVGFLNNWGGSTMTMRLHLLVLEYPEVGVRAAPSQIKRITTRWADLKREDSRLRD